jgi:crotonobetainyl-CoA:carnitine CoA-transferase CaiB-like acyl-CoA transferase
MEHGRPLAGIRVLDFTHVLAGPMCTRLLADLGADVLRVESSKHPDSPWRSASDERIGRTWAYVMVHRGKRSIALDLKTATGLDVARRLGARADVVVENFSAGTMGRLGLDYAALAADNPGLVFVSMSGYGHDGPRHVWTSMNANLQAYSGLMTATGSGDEPPVSISNSWMDYIGGLHGCFSVLEALRARVQSGVGRYVDLAQFECGVASIGALLLAGIVDGAVPPRAGNRSPHAVPQGCYRCAGEDAWCTISVESDTAWRALGVAIGAAEWAAEARLADAVGRLRAHDEIDAKLESWTRTLPPHEVEQRLRAAGVGAQRMRTLDEVLDEPSNDPVFHLLPDEVRPVLMSALPFAFAPRGEQRFGATPRLGEHTGDGLRDWLGLDDAEIASLQQSGALV